MLETILVIIFIILLFLLLDKSVKKQSIENFEDNTDNTNNNIFTVSRPFVNLYDNKGRQINVTLLSRPFYMDSHYKDYDKIKEKFLILGISSYQEFPNEPKNPKDNYNNKNQYNYIKWVNMCEGWLHCFRNKDDYIPKNMKNLLLSESDFTDCNVNVPNKNVEKKYDFIYICHRDDLGDCSAEEWVAYNKNLKLAEKCFSIICEKTNYKGLLIGRDGCKLPNKCENKLEITKKLGYHELLKKYDEVKCIFIPNISDASPRVLTEAFCHDIPCLVNENIVGGWKYVTPETGEFFKDDTDFEEKLNKLMNNLSTYQPRKHYLEHYGPKKSGEKLKDFIYEIFGDRVNLKKNEVDYITPEFKKVDFKDCS